MAKRFIIFFTVFILFTLNVNSATITEPKTQDQAIGAWKTLDMNLFSNLIDFCYSRSLRKSYEDFYDKYNDFPGKLISVDRQIVEGTKLRLKYLKANQVIEVQLLCKPWLAGSEQLQLLSISFGKA